jgi:hypothetical protein
MLKKKFESSCTFDTFKLFFPQKKFARLHIGPWMACNIVSIKTGKVGKNVGFSGTHRTSDI